MLHGEERCYISRWIGIEAGPNDAAQASIRAKVHPFLDVTYAKVTGAWPRTRTGWRCCWGFRPETRPGPSGRLTKGAVCANAPHQAPMNKKRWAVSLPQTRTSPKYSQFRDSLKRCGPRFQPSQARRVGFNIQVTDLFRGTLETLGAIVIANLDFSLHGRVEFHPYSRLEYGFRPL